MSVCKTCGEQYCHCGLPAVAGRTVLTSFEMFERKCLLKIAEEQAKINPDNSLIDVLCEAVRLKREHCDYHKNTFKV